MAKKIVTKQLKDLHPNPQNPRKISQEGLEALKKSLDEFGPLDGFVFNRRSQCLIGGHQRTTVSPKDSQIFIDRKFEEPTKTGTVAEGWIEINGERHNYREVDVDEQREKAMNIAVNKHGGQFDMPKVIEWLHELDAHNYDLGVVGFSNEELEEIMAPTFGTEGLTDADETPEAPKEAKTKRGELWLLGTHRVLCGDATDKVDVERLMDGEKADMVFTDPPYGYSYESNYYRSGNPHGMLKNDDAILDFLPLAKASMKSDSAIYVCASHQTAHLWRALIDAQFAYKNMIVWKKNNWSMGDLKGAFAGQHELIFFAHQGRVEIRGDRARDVWEFDREPPKDHPTQKPVELCEFAISKASDRNAVILDQFLGSGSTLIACEKTQRKCFGMEIEPLYIDVILTRWAKFTGEDPIREDGVKWSELCQSA